MRKVNIGTKYTKLQITEFSSGYVKFWKVHNCVSLSCRRCFFNFHLKVNVVEDLISFGIEDHTLGPINKVVDGFVLILIFCND